MDGRPLWEFLVSTGYGLLSSLVPVFNSEVYLLAVQALGLTAELSAALGLAVGQALGKMAVVAGLRHGVRWPVLARALDRLRQRSGSRAERTDRERTDPGRLRSAYRRWSRRLLDLAGDRRWGPLVVGLSGVTGLPPALALQFLIPATRMPVWVFGLAFFLGRCGLFLAIAFGASAIIARWWP